MDGRAVRRRRHTLAGPVVAVKLCQDSVNLKGGGGRGKRIANGVESAQSASRAAEGGSAHLVAGDSLLVDAIVHDGLVAGLESLQEEGVGG